MFYKRFKTRIETAQSLATQLRLDDAAYDTYLATEFLLKALLANKNMNIAPNVTLDCLKSIVDSRYNYTALTKLEKHIQTLNTYSLTYPTHVPILGLDAMYLKEVWSVLTQIDMDFQRDIVS